MDPNAPGKSTSEFQITSAITLISAIIGLIGIVHPGFKIDPETQRLIAVTVIAGMTLVGSVYTHSRATLKAAKLTADATVAASPLGAAALLPNGTQQFNVGQQEPSAGGQF